MSNSSNVIDFAGPKARELCKAVARNAGSVGVLFVGEPGGGQDALADELTKSYLCLSPNDGAACGACTACVVYEKGMAPDVLDIEPIKPSDIILLGMIVEQDEFERKRNERKHFKPHVRGFLFLGPIQAATKVVVIRRAERMNNDAFNALLKMLEEPPDYARFILTTSAASQMPDTIRSRCALIPCDLPPRSDSSFPERAAAGAPELRAKLESEPMTSFLTAFESWYTGLPSRTHPEALKVGEEFQELIPLYKEGLSGEIEDRFARADVVRFFANLTARDGNANRLAKLIEMHKAVQGNVNFAYLCDAFFTSEL